MMLDSYEVAKFVTQDFTPPSGNDVMSLAIEFGRRRTSTLLAHLSRELGM